MLSFEIDLGYASTDLGNVCVLTLACIRTDLGMCVLTLAMCVLSLGYVVVLSLVMFVLILAMCVWSHVSGRATLRVLAPESIKGQPKGFQGYLQGLKGPRAMCVLTLALLCTDLGMCALTLAMCVLIWQCFCTDFGYVVSLALALFVLTLAKFLWTHVSGRATLRVLERV